MRSVSHPGTHHIVFQLNLGSHVYFDPSSFYLQGLFAPQASHRIGNGDFNRLKGDCNEGYQYGGDALNNF